VRIQKEPKTLNPTSVVTEESFRGLPGAVYWERKRNNTGKSKTTWKEMDYEGGTLKKWPDALSLARNRKKVGKVRKKAAFYQLYSE